MESPPLGAFPARRPPLCVKEALSTACAAPFRCEVAAVRGANGALYAPFRCEVAAVRGANGALDVPYAVAGLPLPPVARFLGVCVCVCIGHALRRVRAAPGPAAAFRPGPAAAFVPGPAAVFAPRPARGRLETELPCSAAAPKRGARPPQCGPAQTSALARARPRNMQSQPHSAQAPIYELQRTASRSFPNSPPTHPPTNPICTSRDSLPVSSSRPPPLIPPPPPNPPNPPCALRRRRRAQKK